MKKICILFLAVVTVCFFGCEKKEEIILPPTRISEKDVPYRVTREYYSFDEVCMMSSIIAHVRIGNWVGEKADIDDVEYSSFYEAEIVKLYKGESKDKIIIRQEGCSKGSYAEFPLLTYGNEIFVFLSRWHEDVYYILNTQATIFDVAKNKNNETFFMSRFGQYCEEMNLTKNPDVSLRVELRNYLIDIDPIFKDIRYGYKYIYKETDVDSFLKRKLGTSYKGD